MLIFLKTNLFTTMKLNILLKTPYCIIFLCIIIHELTNTERKWKIQVITVFLLGHI